MNKKNNSNLFIILIVINITLLLTSNIITTKLISICNVVFTAADLLFPITYILNDVFVEVYGYKKAKFTILIGFLSNLMMVLIFYLTIIMPYPSYWHNQEAFTKILNFTPRILIASFMAYLIGNFLNAKIMDKMKNNNKENKLYKRTILSTVIAELFDTIVFTFIAFIGTLNNIQLLNLTINTYILKVLVEILFTPITYLVINKIRKVETYEEKNLYCRTPV